MVLPTPQSSAVRRFRHYRWNMLACDHEGRHEEALEWHRKAVDEGKHLRIFYPDPNARKQVMADLIGQAAQNFAKDLLFEMTPQEEGMIGWREKIGDPMFI